MRKLFLMIALAAIGYAISTAVLGKLSENNTSVEYGDYTNVIAAYSADTIVFTSSTCVYCAAEIAYLDRNNIRHKEIVVDKNNRDMEYLIRELKQNSVPVIVRGDRLLSGFDEQKLADFLDVE